jgi:serine/threonine protein kinase
MTTRTGTRLGRFVIEAELGRGTMGMVCRARDPKIDRLVAIKTISLFGLEPEAEAEYRERFFIEAQAAGATVSPGYRYRLRRGRGSGNSLALHSNGIRSWAVAARAAVPRKSETSPGNCA